jgi:MFS family permease
MKNRKIRILAWGLSAVAVGGALAQLILWAINLTGLPTLYDAGQALGWGLAMPVVFSVLAALIVARQPGNRVGWLMMIVGLWLGSPAGLYVQRLSGPPAAMTPGLWLLLWLDGWSWIPVIFPVLLTPLYFPTGQPPTPRWRWIGRLAVLMWIAFMILWALAPEIGPPNADWTMANPVGFIPQEFLDGSLVWAVWGTGLVAIALGSVASLFVRYRRAATDERQQIKWLLFAGAFLAVFYTLSVSLPDAVRSTGWWDLLFLLAILCIPIAVAVAIFRYRLWDLEVVVNRALIYGLLTTLLAGIFAGGIPLITEASKQLLGEGSKAAGTAISALIVAVVFQPLRTWIEAEVNKRFYPEKEDLASGLVEVEPEYWGFLDRPALLRVSMEHVRRVLGTSHAAFFLASEGGVFCLAQQVDGSAGDLRSIQASEEERRELEKKRVIAAEGSGSLAAHVPVYVDRGETSEVLGLLSIGARENGKGYSGDDLKGLAELGGKVGLALNASNWARLSSWPGRPRPGRGGAEWVSHCDGDVAQIRPQPL